MFIKCGAGGWVDFPPDQVTARAEARGDGESLCAPSVGVELTHGGRFLLHNLHRRRCCELLLVQSAAPHRGEDERESGETRERTMWSFFNAVIFVLYACVGVCMFSVGKHMWP